MYMIKVRHNEIKRVDWPFKRLISFKLKWFRIEVQMASSCADRLN